MDGEMIERRESVIKGRGNDRKKGGNQLVRRGKRMGKREEIDF